jgi:mediator of replication checkpoint protein 1
MLQEAEPENTEDADPVSSNVRQKEAQDEELEDEDEAVVARPRKLQQRRRRSNTPEADNAEPELVQTTTFRISRAASRSPGLFVSSPIQPRSPAAQTQAVDSDSDADLPDIKNARFKEILARKRKERLAREAEEERKRAARLAIQQAEDDLMADDGDDSNVTDDDGGRTLTQKGRPTRKASKKALEEMSRETQRITRSLQLAHEAKTKKKITKATLFERFNFKPEGGAASGTKPASSSRPTSPVSATHTDAEMKEVDTPPSSPPAPGKPADGGKTALPETNIDSLMLDDDNGDDLPTLEEAVAAAATARQKTLDKGKGIATAADLEAEEKPVLGLRRNVRVKLPVIHANIVTLGSDDELDIQPAKGKGKIDAILDRVPINRAKESRSMYALRRLANLDDPDKKGSAPSGVGKKTTKPAMTAGELHLSLVQRARAQAKLERDRRLELLKSKGIHVPTEEEREKERAEVEDIVARAREEAEEIMQREREDEKKAKKARKEAGEVDPLAWDDSDASDDDYEEENEKQKTKAIELSGSEEEDEEMDDEEMDDEEDGEEEETGLTKGGLIDDAAESGAESEDAEVEGAGRSSEDENVFRPRQTTRRPKKHVTILSDDDESDHHIEATPRPKVAYPKSPSAPNTASPKVPTSVLRSATKTFIPGLPVAGPAGLGLTQIFAGTMDDSQAGPFGASPSQMMPSFDNFPDSQFSQTAQDDMVLNSQPTQKAPETQAEETQGVQLHFSQSQMHGFDSFLQQADATQQSELLEPTQDGGFQEYTPLKQRFVEPPASTIDTVVLSESQRNELQHDSPLVRRAGKLRRRADVLAAARAAEEDPEEDASPMDGVEFDEFGFGTTSAFTLMKDAATKEKNLKAKAEFDKKKSKAKEMIEEQAEESEDEYAGLGGADGEDSDDDSNASVHEMVDDDTKLNEADKAKLKAFYAYVPQNVLLLSTC